jgi:hypothetical protein
LKYKRIPCGNKEEEIGIPRTLTKAPAAKDEGATKAKAEKEDGPALE